MRRHAAAAVMRRHAAAARRHAATVIRDTLRQKIARVMVEFAPKEDRFTLDQRIFLFRYHVVPVPPLAVADDGYAIARGGDDAQSPTDPGVGFRFERAVHLRGRRVKLRSLRNDLAVGKHVIFAMPRMRVYPFPFGCDTIVMAFQDIFYMGHATRKDFFFTARRAPRRVLQQFPGRRFVRRRVGQSRRLWKYQTRRRNG